MATRRRASWERGGMPCRSAGRRLVDRRAEGDEVVASVHRTSLTPNARPAPGSPWARVGPISGLAADASANTVLVCHGGAGCWHLRAVGQQSQQATGPWRTSRMRCQPGNSRSSFCTGHPPPAGAGCKQDLTNRLFWPCAVACWSRETPCPRGDGRCPTGAAADSMPARACAFAHLAAAIVLTVGDHR